MADKLSVYNAALSLLGQKRLANLADNREERRVLDDLWDAAVGYCLEEGMWHFAVRTVELSSDAGIEPAFGYRYAFARPDDWVRTAGVGIEPMFNQPLTAVASEAGYWWADTNPLYIRYISSDPSSGGDLSLWPPSFTKFVAAHLAAEACVAILGNTSRLEDLRKLEKQRRTEARSKDAMNEPTTFMPTGTWVNARMGNWWGGLNREQR